MGIVCESGKKAKHDCCEEEMLNCVFHDLKNLMVKRCHKHIRPQIALSGKETNAPPRAKNDGFPPVLPFGGQIELFCSAMWSLVGGGWENWWEKGFFGG
jgi:hypothetical protein